jgi:large subunit ribosomal protein L9
MEIILTEDVVNLGLAGQVLKVSPGYARNYLLPGNRALLATPHNLKILAKKREEFEHRSRAAKDEAQDVQKRLEPLVITIRRKSVEKGKLYGAVTPQDIADEVGKEGIIIEKKRIKLSEPIKTLGDYEIVVRIHPEVTGSFKLKVLQEEIPEPPAPPEGAQADGTKPEGKSRKRKSDSSKASAPKAEAAPESKPESKPESEQKPKGKAKAKPEPGPEETPAS